MCAVVVSLASLLCFFFCSTVTSSTEIYTLSLHDALPICAELVRSIRREAPQLLEGHVETRQCLVEHAAETAELVGRIRHGQAGIEGVRRDAARRVRHGPDRRQHAPGEEIAPDHGQAQGARSRRRHDDGERPQRLANRLLVASGDDPMGGLVDRAPAKRHRAGGGPARGAIDDRRAFGDLELHARARRELAQIARLLAVDLVDGRQVFLDLLVERSIEAHPDENEDADGEKTDDERQCGRVPQREAGAYRGDGDPHPRSRRRTKPTPRTVWSSFTGNGSSILRRRRAIDTSMTLSSGVARAATRHTSRVSISRETTRPT